MTTPTLKDFWARFDYEEFNNGEPIRIEPDSLSFEQFESGYTRASETRKTWLLLQNIETLDIWAVEVWTADSWDDSENSERFIKGPFKVKAVPRQITVYDYEAI